MLYRRELVDLSKDSEETRLCVKIAGLSLMPGPYKIHTVKVDDSTEEGREEIKKLIERGYEVESIKTDNSTEKGREMIKNHLKRIGIDPK